MQLIVVIVVVNKSFWDVQAVERGAKLPVALIFHWAESKNPLKPKRGPYII